jgi:hypothetical protein
MIKKFNQEYALIEAKQHINGEVTILKANATKANVPAIIKEQTKAVITIDESHDVLPNARKPQSSFVISSVNNLPYAMVVNTNNVKTIYFIILCVYLVNFY